MRIVQTVSPILLLIILLTSLSNIGCGNPSRYRLDLYMQGAQGQKLAKVENTKFIIKSRFLSHPDDIEMLQGDNNTLIATISTHWKKSDSRVEDVLVFDDVVRYRVFFSIPEPVKATSFELRNTSVAQLSGHYDIAPEKKIFTPAIGSLVIDSVAHSHFFVTIDGTYKNIDGERLKLKGQFKAKYR